MKRKLENSAPVVEAPAIVPAQDRPPHMLDVCAGIARRCLEYRTAPLDTRIPREPVELAKWWLARQEHDLDDPDPWDRTSFRDGRWHTPIADRVGRLLEKFLRLPAWEQGIIIAAHDDPATHVHWRGETVPEITRLCDIIEGRIKVNLGARAYA